MHPGDLYAVVGDAEDDRSIAHYVAGRGFEAKMLPCPGMTGSWLASDGVRLFMSQRFEKRILELDPATGDIKREIPVRREITGLTMRDGAFYMLTTESREIDDYRLIRLDADDASPVERELARIPFVGGRGLAHDGAAFWTSLRSVATLVSFTFAQRTPLVSTRSVF